MAAARRLLERDREMAGLDSVLDDLVRDGRGRAVLLEGEPGIGKTTLLHELVTAAARRGVPVLRAAGAELEHELAFGGVRQLFAPALRLPAPELDRLLAGPARLARPVLGLDEATAGGLSDPLWGLYCLTANLTEREPAVFAVDDLQWVDVESQRYLAHLIRRLDGLRVALVAATRPASTADGTGVDLAALGADVWQVRPLSARAVHAALEQPSNPAAPDDHARWHAVTRGNPLLVGALARARREGRAVEPPTDAATVVAWAAARAGSGAQELLEALALFVAGARLADVSHLTGLDQADCARVADRLVADAVLAVRDGQLAFAHPELRHVVYESTGALQRRVGHGRAAELLLARGAPLEEVAGQLLVAEPTGSARAVDVLCAVADHSRARGAIHAATRYLARALVEPPEPGRRFEVARELGRAQARLGLADAVDTLRTALQAAPTPRARVDVAVDLAATCFATMRYDEAVEVLAAARDDAQDDEQRLTVDAVLATTAWESTRWAHLYAQVADRLPADLPGSTTAQRLALGVVGARMFDRCEPYGRVRDVLLRAAGGDSSAMTVCGVDLGDPVSLLIACAAVDDARRLCEARQEEARRQGRDALYAASQVGLARIALLCGDLREAEAIVRLALELPGVHEVDRAMLLHQLASVRIAQGRLDEAEQSLQASSTEGMPVSASVRLRQARIDQLRGHHERAVAAYEAVRRTYDARDVSNPAERLWLVHHAAALAAAGRRSEGVEVVRELVVRATAFGAPQPLGVCHVALGTLTTGEEALQALTTGVRVLDASPYRLDAAQAHLELGAALRRANRRTEAREHLATALGVAQQVGATPVADRADQELRASGARPRRRSQVGPDALTPSEERVARLAAEGRTNAQIAAHLFLTVKTVEMHMSRVLRKLSVASRRDVAAALAERPSVLSR